MEDEEIGFPKLQEWDFGEACSYLHEEARRLDNLHQIPWQFRDGWNAYKKNLPMVWGYKALPFPDSRKFWRMGWMAAMLLDLNSRDQVILSRRVGNGQ